MKTLKIIWTALLLGFFVMAMATIAPFGWHIPIEWLIAYTFFTVIAGYLAIIWVAID